LTTHGILDEFETQSAISSADEDELKKPFKLPSELISLTLQNLYNWLNQETLPEEACRRLLPYALVSRTWHELCRPMTFMYIRVNANRSAMRLYSVLNTPRRWSQYVKSLRISFGLHFNPAFTPTLLGLIASCYNLDALNLWGCGKPVYKSFAAQANSVHHAGPLNAVLKNVKRLETSGARKSASTGLDAAKVLAFLLPFCPNLETLVRGRYTYHSTQVASLQPLPIEKLPVLNKLQSLTLSSKHIGSRVLVQALEMAKHTKLRALVLICADAPQRRHFEDLLVVLAPNLHVLKIEIPFPTHRLHVGLDGIISTIHRLRQLTLVGPLCTDDLLQSLPLTVPDLRSLTLSQNKAVTPSTLSNMLSLYDDLSRCPRRLSIDDLVHPSWSEASLSDIKETAIRSNWQFDCSSVDWFDLALDEDMIEGIKEPPNAYCEHAEAMETGRLVWPGSVNEDLWLRAAYKVDRKESEGQSEDYDSDWTSGTSFFSKHISLQS